MALGDLIRRLGQNIPGMGGGGRAEPPTRAFVTTGEAHLEQALEANVASATRAYAQTRTEEIAKQKQAERDLEIEMKAQERENRRVRALRSTTDFGNDLADHADGLARELATGKIDREKAIKSLDEHTGKLKEQYGKLIPEDHFEPSKIVMENNGRDTRRKFLGVLEAHRRDETVANFRGVREGLERRATTDLDGSIAAYEASAKVILRDAGVPAKEIEKDVQQFREHTTYTYVAGQIARSGEKPAELKAWQKTIADGSQYSALDPDKRRILSAQVEHRLDVLTARADRAREVRLNGLGRELEQTERLAQRGVFPDVNRLAALQAATKGTPYEGGFRSLVTEIEDTRGFMRLDPASMRRELEKERNTTIGNTGTAEDLRRVERRSQIFQATVKQLHDDPLGYHERTTGMPTAPIDLNNPKGLADSLRARADILTSLNKTHGANLGLLRPEEVQQAAALMRQLPAEKKASLLRTVYGAVKDGPVFNATMAQLAPDSPVTAFAGKIMHAGNAWVPNSIMPGGTELRAGEVAGRMLRGEQILNPPAAVRKEDGKPAGFKVKETDFNLYFNNNAGTAFAGNDKVRDVYYQAVKAVYADLSVQESDYTGEANSTRVKKAWELVTGGGATNFNSTRVIAPFGMTSDTLKERIRGDWAALKKAGRIDVDDAYLGYAGLRQIDDGQFLVLKGNSFLQDSKTGEPIVLDVNRKVVK